MRAICIWALLAAAIFLSPMDASARAKSAQKPAEPVMVSVESTVIKSIGYAGRRRVLDVALRNGHRYRYFQVPARVAKEFMAAASKGHFYNRSIKSAYRFSRLD